MFFLLFGIVFYGLTHPVGALLLTKNNNALIFSFMYVFYRVILQLPSLLLTFKEQGFNKKIILLFFLSGIIGSFLHWIEFESLKANIPISHVTFITFSFPIWVILYELKNTKIYDHISVIKLILGVLGLFFIISPNKIDPSLGFKYLLPLGASFLLASWIKLSSKIKELNVNPFLYSFFYDFLSVIGIFLIIQTISKNTNQTILMNDVYNGLRDFNPGLFLYALFVGVFPNILMFFGLKEVKASKASLLMLLEPVISCFCSVILFKDNFDFKFIVGASFIFIANFPDELIKSFLIRLGVINELSTQTNE